MAKPKVEIQIPKDLGLTRTQVSDLQKSFEKQLVETLKGKQATDHHLSLTCHKKHK